MPDHDFSAQLEILQKDFAAALPVKVERLVALLRQCASAFRTNQGLPREGLRDAHLLVHGLAGASGLFGFSALGEAAHVLEEGLSPLLHDETPADEAVFTRIEQALATLQAASLAPATPVTEFAMAPASQASAKPSARLIYLVQKDAMQAASLAAQLRPWGYQVLVFDRPQAVVPEGQSALAAIVMEVDFLNGALVGPQALKRALGHHFHGVPLLFLGGRGDFAARLEAVRAGGVAYFTPPVAFEALVDALDAVTGKNQPAAYRILIVDDSASTAAFYQQALVAAGMEARVITDPSQILEPLDSFAPDLILMDLYMPVCNGVELAALIRQQPHFVRIPIVFLSTETNINRHLVALRQGGDDFLCKPIDPVRLVSVVTSRIGRTRVLCTHRLSDRLPEAT